MGSTEIVVEQICVELNRRKTKLVSELSTTQRWVPTIIVQQTTARQAAAVKKLFMDASCVCQLNALVINVRHE